MREFLIFCALGLLLPLVLIGIAWRRYDKGARTTLIIPALSVIFLLLIIRHDLRWILLGPDYSNRLYTTIEINALFAGRSAVYSGIRRGWMALVASVFLVLAWLWVGAVNSVV